HRQIARGDERHFARAAELDLRGTDPGSGLEQGLGAPSPKAPLDEALGFNHARVPAWEARDHFDQTSPVLLGRARETIAGLVGVAGLKAVRAGHHAQDRVAVPLRDVLPGAERL